MHSNVDDLPYTQQHSRLFNDNTNVIISVNIPSHILDIHLCFKNVE